MASSTVKLEGFDTFEQDLRDLGSKITAKNVTKRALLKALQPTVAAMRARAPDDPRTHGNDLKSSITASDKLSPRQAGLARSASGGGAVQTAGGWKSAAKDTVTVYAGPGALPQAHLQEFGTATNAAQPYVRPAWDQTKGGILQVLATEFRVEINKAAQRRAKKAAR